MHKISPKTCAHGVFQFECSKDENILKNMLIFLKIHSDHKSTNFSFVSKDHKTNLNDTVKDLLFREHFVDYQTRDIKELFRIKNSPHLLSFLDYKLEGDELASHFNDENIKMFSIISALLHRPKRAVLIEFGNGELNGQFQQKLATTLRYEVEHNGRAIYLAGEIPKALKNVVDFKIKLIKSGEFQIKPKSKDSYKQKPNEDEAKLAA